MKKHRPLGNILRTLLVCLLLQGSVAIVKAQSQQGDYFVENGIAFYRGEPFGNVDLPTFIELGFGYAKDRYNVYFRGEIMEFVDPLTFRLKVPQWPHPDYDDSYYDRGDYRRSGYMVTSNAVLFRGRIVEKANPDSFKELGGDMRATRSGPTTWGESWRMPTPTHSITSARDMRPTHSVFTIWAKSWSKPIPTVSNCCKTGMPKILFTPTTVERR